MFQQEELILLAALGHENGFVENRRLKSDQGWIRLFEAMVSDGYPVLVSENVPEKGDGDYLISTYQITAKGRNAARALTRRDPQDEEQRELA